MPYYPHVIEFKYTGNPKFTSDRHIGHRKIIKYCQRPFAVDRDNPTKEEARKMDDIIIANHNSLINPGEDYFDLGDFAFCTTYDYALECLQRMNGKPHFVRGNHDGIMDEIYAKHPELFASYDRGYKEIEVKGQIIILCHYKMQEWWHAMRGTWHLFGHTHGLLRPIEKAIDVGVDNMNFFPVTFSEIREFMSTQPIGQYAKFEKYDGEDRV
jgi:calcineurin-like phosphoesterase family protein